MKNLNDIIRKNNEVSDVNDPFAGFESREDFLNERKQRETTVNVIEKQKILIWTRVFLNEEDDTLKPGDSVFIEYLETGEKLETTFAAYNKKNNAFNREGDIVTGYEPENDRKVLCLSFDIEWLDNPNNDIPFIRTLFKHGRFYEFQLMKLTELKISSDKKEFEFHSVDF